MKPTNVYTSICKQGENFIPEVSWDDAAGMVRLQAMAGTVAGTSYDNKAEMTYSPAVPTVQGVWITGTLARDPDSDEVDIWVEETDLGVTHVGPKAAGLEPIVHVFQAVFPPDATTPSQLHVWRCEAAEEEPA